MLSKQDKWLVIHWIDLQFSKEQAFPKKSEATSDASSAAITQLKVWRSWRSLPSKWRFVEEWVNDSLSEKEIEALQQHVKKARGLIE